MRPKQVRHLTEILTVVRHAELLAGGSPGAFLRPTSDTKAPAPSSTDTASVALCSAEIAECEESDVVRLIGAAGVLFQIFNIPLDQFADA